MATARDSFHWNGQIYALGQEVDDKAPVVAACPSLFDRVTPVAAKPAPTPAKVSTARKAKD